MDKPAILNATEAFVVVPLVNGIVPLAVRPQKSVLADVVRYVEELEAENERLREVVSPAPHTHSGGSK